MFILSTHFLPASTVLDNAHHNSHQYNYHVSGIFDDLLKCIELVGFYIDEFQYCIERNPCLQYKWRTVNLVNFTRFIKLPN